MRTGDAVFQGKTSTEVPPCVWTLLRQPPRCHLCSHTGSHQGVGWNYSRTLQQDPHKTAHRSMRETKLDEFLLLKVLYFKISM